MRSIHVEENFRLRFPDRDDHFDDGVEVGMIVAMMTLGTERINRVVSDRVVEQLRNLSMRMGYRLHLEDREADRASVAIVSTSVRPSLRVV